MTTFKASPSPPTSSSGSLQSWPSIPGSACCSEANGARASADRFRGRRCGLDLHGIPQLEKGRAEIAPRRRLMAREKRQDIKKSDLRNDPSEACADDGSVRETNSGAASPGAACNWCAIARGASTVVL